MSDDTNTDADNSTENTDEENSSEEFDADRAKTKIHKANREAAALRARLKELEPKATAYDELKEGEKTESEKATARATAAEKRVAELEHAALRSEVANARGLTAAQAKRLVGSTKEELEADAEELAEAFTSQTGEAGKRKPPTRSLSGGSRPADNADTTDYAAIAESVLNSKGILNG